jgi:hypothetical protein
MTNLTDYLANLNTAENQWSLWVNPKNIEQYRIGQNCFDNGGLNDGFVLIDSLSNLSCGFQLTPEAIEALLESGRIEDKSRKVLVNKKAILAAYCEGSLHEDFQEFLENESEDIKAVWARNEAELKVEEIKDYFAPGGEWEQEQN